MPIYEYRCMKCNLDFERLELSPIEIPTSQCPTCKGIGIKIMSCPAIVAETVDTRLSPNRLPNWHQNNKRAAVRDAWQEYRRRNPVKGDKGAGCKVYNTDGLKEPK